MFKHLSEPAKGAFFYIIVFALALASVLAAKSGLSIIYVMTTPLLATLFMLLVVTRDGYSRAGWAGLGLQRPGFSGRGLGLAGLNPPSGIGV